MFKSVVLICSFMVFQTNIIFDFNKNSEISSWNIVNDVVMGGRSKSTFGLNDEGKGEFKGLVSLANNGGFSSVRYKVNKTDISACSTFVLRIKGDGKNYQFRSKTESGDYYSYISNISTTGKWQTVEIPFNSLKPEFRGRKLNMDNFPGKKLEEIGFLIGNNTAEEFTLLIDWIKLK